jgi:hypothetical protein
LHLFEHLAPTVFAEVDIYWAQVGGSDPKELVTGSDRVGLLREGRSRRRAAEPDGRGRRRVVDIPGVLEASPSANGTSSSWIGATDMFDAVERATTTSSAGLSRGRS